MKSGTENKTDRRSKLAWSTYQACDFFSYSDRVQSYIQTYMYTCIQAQIVKCICEIGQINFEHLACSVVTGLLNNDS